MTRTQPLIHAEIDAISVCPALAVVTGHFRAADRSILFAGAGIAAVSGREEFTNPVSLALVIATRSDGGIQFFTCLCAAAQGQQERGREKETLHIRAV